MMSYSIMSPDTPTGSAGGARSVGGATLNVQGVGVDKAALARGITASDDQVTFSGEALAMLTGRASTSSPGFSSLTVDKATAEAIMDYRSQLDDYSQKIGGFVDGVVGGGGQGPMLISGDISNQISSAAAKAGIAKPEMPAALQKWAKENAIDSPSEPASTDGASAINFATKDGGLAEIRFDATALNSFAGASANDVLSALTDISGKGHLGGSLAATLPGLSSSDTLMALLKSGSGTPAAALRLTGDAGVLAASASGVLSSVATFLSDRSRF
jgi:hypothetical protein